MTDAAVTDRTPRDTDVARLLEVLRDARAEGLWREQAAVIHQLDVDFAHVRFEVRNRPLMPRMLTARDYEEDEEDGVYEPINGITTEEEIAEGNRLRRVGTALEWKRTDWMAWRKRSTITSLSEIYKRTYSDARAPSTPNPLLALARP